jgi:hypothetical protein
MNTQPNDDGLRRLLRENWPAGVRSNPQFRSSVWARIDALRHGPQTWGEWLRLHVLAVGLAGAASVVLAVAVSGWAANREFERERERMVQRYVASIDPHARAGLDPVDYQP